MPCQKFFFACILLTSTRWAIRARDLHIRPRAPLAIMLTLQHLYTAYDVTHRPPEPERLLSTMEHFCKRRRTRASLSAFDRINQCRRGLEALDRQGWLRSYHQRQFHEQFIRACARIFYKTEPPGTFQRDHQRLLQVNGWSNLSQEILISTPRRCEWIYLLRKKTYILTHRRRSREDHLGEPVCGRDPLQRPARGAQHLQHLQTHQSEAAAQCQEIPGPDLHRAGRASVQDRPVQLRGAHGAGPGVEPGHPHGQQLPVQGEITKRFGSEGRVPVAW